MDTPDNNPHGGRDYSRTQNENNLESAFLEDVEMRLCENMSCEADYNVSLSAKDANIKYIPAEGMPPFFNKKGFIYFLVAKENHYKELLRDNSIQIILKKWHFEVKFLNPSSISALSEYIGGDIVCPLFDMNEKIRGYVTAYLEEDSFEDAFVSVLNSVAQYEREYLEEIIIAAAFNAPTVFIDSVNSLFDKDDDSNDSCDGSKHNIPLDLSGIPLLTIGTAALGIDADLNLDIDLVEGLDDISQADSLDSSDISLSQERFFKSANISNKSKKEFLKHIPEKVSERYIKQNAGCKKDLQMLIASVSHEDLQQLFLQLLTKSKGAVEIFDFSRLSAASAYEIHVKRWNNELKGFNYKYHYCIYLKDNKGCELPLRFRHHPAYCLYLMYVLDRAVRGENATYLSIRENKMGYIHLYQTIFGEPFEEAEKSYMTFAYRITKEGTPSRKGRYDDYLRDIDETLTSIVGRADSIPLKIRDGGHLELRPERIVIDEKLRSFKFK